MNIRSMLLLTALVVTASAFADSSTTPPEQASIPFASNGGIRNWQADRDKGLWIQDSRGKWYYAEFMGDTCRGLNFATSIGFDTLPIGTLDRTSTVIVPRDGRCPIKSVVSSKGPEKRKKSQQEMPAATEKSDTTTD
ncbi:DUF6491 family protein [Povalibacter sp.]|uniref:DUF6491 family protein n=1 Tax=Povalibacter sp. TaxID=1962978 RepID=UPI002F419253